MSYERYVAGVQQRRALLQAELTQANQLRRDAQIPTRDVEQELEEQEPLLSQDAYLTKMADQRAFARFRQEHLTKLDQPTIPPELQDGREWQGQRAVAYRNAFLEHEIQQAWLTQAKTHRSQADPQPH